LLLHPHVDPFDIPRIKRALDYAGMTLLSFSLPSPSAGARYDAMFPGDLEHRDFESWAFFELKRTDRPDSNVPMRYHIGTMTRLRFLLQQFTHGIHAADSISKTQQCTMLTLTSIIQRDSEVIAAEADRDLVMVSVATGHYYGISDVAREIWETIERPTRVSDLVNDLVANYQIDSISCEQQTLSFLEALLDEGLLQVKDAPAG
jgi:hypothetical protein